MQRLISFSVMGIVYWSSPVKGVTGGTISSWSQDIQERIIIRNRRQGTWFLSSSLCLRLDYLSLLEWVESFSRKDNFMPVISFCHFPHQGIYQCRLRNNCHPRVTARDKDKAPFPASTCFECTQSLHFLHQIMTKFHFNFLCRTFLVSFLCKLWDEY